MPSSTDTELLPVKPRRVRTTFPSPHSSSSLAIVSADRRATVAAQKRSSASLRAAPRMRSRRPGGSMRSSRQRPSNASRWRSSSGSPGHTSSASHPDSRSSSARLASRKPSAVRICGRRYSTVLRATMVAARWRRSGSAGGTEGRSGAAGAGDAAYGDRQARAGPRARFARRSVRGHWAFVSNGAILHAKR
jgi:hypothetical protein